MAWPPSLAGWGATGVRYGDPIARLLLTVAALGAVVTLAACGQSGTDEARPAPQGPPADSTSEGGSGTGGEAADADGGSAGATDGGDADGPLDRAAFVAAADAICSETRAGVEGLREPQTIEESAAVLAEVVDLSRDELARLRALEPPAEIADRFAELLDLREQQIEALERFGQLLLADDREATGEALLENARLDDESNVIEQELGLEVCGSEPVQEIPNQRRPPASSDADPADG